MIGKRLKLARTAAGLSLRGLAAAIGHRVSAQAIGKYERDEAMPGGGVLAALADAVHSSVDYLVGDPDLVLDDLEFRKNAFTGKRAEARVEARVLADLERYLTVEDILGLPSARWDRPRDAPYPVRHDAVEADRAADALRRHWGLGHEPVGNLVELLEERGIKVFALPLDTVGGLAARARRPGLPPVPVVVKRRGLGRAAAVHYRPRVRSHRARRVRRSRRGAGRAPLRRGVPHAGRGAAARGRQVSQRPRSRRAPRPEARVRRQHPDADPPLPRPRHHRRGHLDRSVPGGSSSAAKPVSATGGRSGNSTTRLSLPPMAAT